MVESSNSCKNTFELLNGIRVSSTDNPYFERSSFIVVSSDVNLTRNYPQAI
jgi:hypothetical protein